MKQIMKICRNRLRYLSVLLSALATCSGFMVDRELLLQQKEKEDFPKLVRLVVAAVKR